MKKTVIIAIFVIYLASIVVVQIFGVPVVVPPASDIYIEYIDITGIELSAPQEGQDTTIREKEQADGRMLYGFKFVEGTYTKDEESLQSNPNRVKINYVLNPDNADKAFLRVLVLGDEEYFYYVEETQELIFLKKLRVEVFFSESRANLDVQDSIIIRST